MLPYISESRGRILSLGQSGLVRFSVGLERKEFHVHSILTANYKFPHPQSRIKYSECHEPGCIVLLETSENTFARFVAYVYTGDYPDSEPSTTTDLISDDDDESTLSGLDTPSQSTSSEQEERAVRTDGSKRHGLPRSWFRWSSKSQRMWHDFRARGFDIVTLEGRPIARANKDKTEDYMPVFLSHAELYTFSVQYGIDRLRTLALQKLHDTLVRFTLHAERCGDVAALIKYTYRHGHGRTTDADGLRSLLHDYMCCKVDELIPNDDFKRMLRKEDPKLLDVLERLLRRLDRVYPQ